MPAEVESMFYYGDTPWHKLGKEVPNTLTAEEAIVAAGLDWEVEKVNIFHNFKGSKVKIENKRAIRRQTDGRILGVTSPRYEPVQNRDAFKFFDSVTATGEAKYHTAGSLQGGQKVWMLAKLDKNGPLNIRGDQVDKYILLVNGHDAGMSLKMFFTPIRVVCMNTLMAAESGAKRLETFRAVHFGNISAKLDTAHEILGITLKFFEHFEEQALRLAHVQLPAAELPKLLVAAFQTTGAVRPEDVIDLSIFSTRMRGEMEKVEALFLGEGKGLNQDNIRGTKWAAYNAIAEYVDYGKPVRARETTNVSDVRLGCAWFVNGPKKRAWDYLTKK